jgi:hypothetical protein
MNEKHEISFDKQVYYRLITLWVLCEGFLGGIIHGLKIPVSGLIVGSSAVICICLIAYYVRVRGAIFKATIIVCIFKMMLSPHSPPTAYIAVLFQGCIGQLLFFDLRFFKISCYIVGLLSLVESAIQRILVLLILYGTDFWNAVNQFISRLTNQQTITNYSLAIATGYILLHAVVGLFVGWFATYLVAKARHWRKSETILIKDSVPLEQLKKDEKSSSKKKIFKNSLVIIWFVLILILIQSLFNIGTPILPAHTAVQILFRSLLIVLTWYLIISPIAMRIMKRWLEDEKKKASGDIQQILLLLPSTKYLVYKSWQIAEGKASYVKLKNTLKIIVANTLYNHNAR